uniref:Relaxin-3 receptor 1 n=1 Tax=Crocodylus porosus TaxID=8502 RepID=A0A7M4FB81_CROPO
MIHSKIRGTGVKLYSYLVSKDWLSFTGDKCSRGKGAGKPGRRARGVLQHGPGLRPNSDPSAPAAPRGGGGSAAVRLAVSAVYSVVCALGLVGNALVLHLMRGKRGWRKSSMNLFVTSLAATDLQFVLTLPFWAVENALDFTWLFGRVMCKVVSYVTAMNMYASVFFLTAMSVARYRAVASVLKSQPSSGCGCGCGARGLCALIWALAMVAALPHAIFSTTANVFGEELCLLRFPDSPSARAQLWLGLYQVQKVLLGFVVPLGVISLCYARLVRFLRGRHAGQRRSAKVTRSVSVVVLSFFVCWLPNQALTAWGVLVKLNAVPFGPAYFLSQAYLFPVSVCLAHCNSCLNPVLYCLMRREFRQALKNLLWRLLRRWLKSAGWGAESPAAARFCLYTPVSGLEASSSLWFMLASDSQSWKQ